jgi:hypothetical protein
MFARAAAGAASRRRVFFPGLGLLLQHRLQTATHQLAPARHGQRLRHVQHLAVRRLRRCIAHLAIHRQRLLDDQRLLRILDSNVTRIHGNLRDR